MELLEIHLDMYLAALEERRAQEAEEAMTAHLDKNAQRAMAPAQMQHLSLYRVNRYFDEFAARKKALGKW